MKRYTYKALETDCAKLNAQMKADGIPWVLATYPMSTRTHLDVAKPAEGSKHAVYSNLRIGTPRECLTEAQLFVHYAIIRKGVKA